MSDMGITIKIAGKLEKSFNEAVRAAQSGLSGLNAAVSKEMTEVGNISSAAAMKMADAGKMYAGASRDMAAAGKMGASASRRMATEGMAAAASSRDVASAGNGAASTFREMAAEGGRAADAILDIASTGKVSVSSVQGISSALKGIVTGFKDMSAQGRNASKDLLAGGKETVNLSKDLSAGGKGIVSLSKDMGKAGEMAGAASQGFLLAGAAIGATVAVAATAGKAMREVAEYSVEVGKEFESSMSDAAATADASAEDFAKMEQAAMEMGKTTSKTASESAKALEYMSLAGWDVDTSISALPSVLKMSEASGMELGQTSDLVTDSMAALGVTVEQLPGYLDIATKAQTKSNQSAQQLMEAYIGVGGTMKSLNVPIEESATALGVLANRGIKGAEGGNALNAVMVNLTTGTGQAGKMMKELGVSAFDQQGKFIGVEATLQQLNGALQGYSEEQRNAALAAIGGKQHMDALNALMAGLNTTNEEGVPEWAALTSELENCGGSLQKMRDIKLDNLEGDLKTLESATQDAGIKIYKHLNAPMREFTQFKIKAVYDASDALEKDGFAGMAMSAGGAIADGVGMVIERLPEFLAKAVVSVGSFLVGFATELPASLLTGIIKGVPRLLKALPGIGVDIVKAIIKGVLSVGSAPLKAVGSLFFGGGDDKKIKDAGADIAEAQASEIRDDIAAPADIQQALQPAQIDGAAMEGYAPSAKEGMTAMPGSTGDMAGQDISVPNIAADAAGMTGIADMGLQASGIEQVSAGIHIDTAQLADGTEAMMADTPIAIDTPPALREAGGSGNDIYREAPATIPTGVLSVPSEGSAEQAPISAKGIDVESLMPNMDVTGIGEGVTMPPIDAAQDIAPTPPWAAPDIPTEIIQASPVTVPDISTEIIQASPVTVPDISTEIIQASPVTLPDIPTEITQISPEIILDMPAGAARMSPGVMPDMAIDALQISPDAMPDVAIDAAQASAGVTPDMAVEVAQRPAGIVQAPSDIVFDAARMGGAQRGAGAPDIHIDAPVIAATETAGSQTMPEAPIRDITAPAPENIRIGEIEIPSIGVDMAGISDGIAQVREAVRAGVSGSLSGQPVRISGDDVDDAGLSGKMRAVGARGGQAFMDGIGKSIGGVIDAPRVGVNMGLAAPMPQIPLQGVVQTVSVGAVRGEALDMTAAQDTAKGAGDISGASPGMGRLPAMVAAQDPSGGTEAISGWARKVADMFRDVLGIPDWDILSRPSVVEETLDALLEERMDQNRPISDAAPSFTLNLTIKVEGGGNIKKDVTEAAKLGAREFERYMEDWIRKHRRTGFRPGFEGIFG